MISSVKAYAGSDWKTTDIIVGVFILSFAWMLSDMWGKVINQGFSLLFPDSENNFGLHFVLVLLLTIGFALFLKWRRAEKVVTEM